MIQINGITCNKATPGTGMPDCYLTQGMYKSAYLVTDPTWELILATDTYDQDYVIEKIMDGTFHPLLQSDDWTRNTPDPTRQDYTGGISRTVRNGKPMGMFMFNNGPLWHANVSQFNGRSDLRMILIDNAGTQRLQKSVDGLKITAIPLSDFNVATYVEQVGDTNASTNIEYQIADEVAYNTRPALLPVSQTGFDGNTEVKGIIDTTITGSGDISDGKITINVKSVINPDFGARGLTATDFRVVNNANNTEVTITSVVPNPLVPGEYAINATLTGITSVTVSTYDADLDVIVARVGTSTQLFRGENTNITIAA